VNGPAARRAIHPCNFVAYLDAKSSYIIDGPPRRRRLCINGIPVTPADARMIRRWRQGNIEGITIPCGAALLRRYSLTPLQFSAWCAILHLVPTIRGSLRESD
jgi:hypothetical protein